MSNWAEQSYEKTGWLSDPQGAFVTTSSEKGQSDCSLAIIAYE